MDIPPIPTQSVADQFHAGTRDSFEALVSGMPPMINAPLQTHATALGIRCGLEASGDLLEAARKVVDTLAYAAVTERARRDELRDASDA